MTERLYYNDSYLRDFTADVVDRSEDGRRVYLDRTAFYPASGGQPFDTGSLDGAAVTEVVDEGDRIAHVLDRSIEAGRVNGSIDWHRRLDHMQQHSGQHLLSAAIIEVTGIHTVSFHLGQAVSTIDLETRSMDLEQIRASERRANEIVIENRPIRVTYEENAEGLRRESDREGMLRVVSIDGLDRIACGGTHVRLTGEIGPILIRRAEKVRDTTRLEFLCGSRAVARARADFDALSRIARHLSSQLDETPALVEAQVAAAKAAEKNRRALAAQLSAYEGRELFAATLPDSGGVRRTVRRVPAGSLEDMRPLAQSYAAGEKAIFIGVIESPPSFLMAVSEDSGVDAGKLLKAAVSQFGGRGGGNSRVAQGSIPSAEHLDRVLERLS